MKRDLIDFHEVPAGQVAMHERLLLWGRMCYGAAPGDTAAPMFRQFQTTYARGDAPPPAAVPMTRTDRSDAVVLGKAINLLPEPHRLALQWYYVRRSSVADGRRMLACTAEGLHRYVLDARTMLISREAYGFAPDTAALKLTTAPTSSGRHL